MLLRVVEVIICALSALPLSRIRRLTAPRSSQALRAAKDRMRASKDYVLMPSGRKMPRLAFGTAGVYFKSRNAAVAKDGVALALDSGFKHIDTAEEYGNEDRVGLALEERGRDDVFVTTKAYASPPILEEGAKWHPQDLTALLEEQLRGLKLPAVDMYLLHVACVARQLGMSNADLWQAFESVQTQGLAADVGVSNFSEEALRNLLASKPATLPAINQIELHPLCWWKQKPVVELCRQHGILVGAFAVLVPLVGHSGSSVPKLPEGPLYSVLTDMAGQRGCTAHQIVLLWALSKADVVINTTTSRQHAEETVAVFEMTPLTDDEVALIDAAVKHMPTVQVYERDTLE